jgi:hypothetical protein
VLPSGDADALGALINETDFRPEEAIVLIFHDEDSAIVAGERERNRGGGP